MELSIDTASDWASVALSQEGRLKGEVTWRCYREHSTQLMPMVETLLSRLRVDKSELTAVFVCTGPGSYAALRVGVPAIAPRLTSRTSARRRSCARAGRR